MSKAKGCILAGLAIIALITSAFIIAGLIEPSVDPEFEENLTQSPPIGVPNLIAVEAEKLGVTAMAVTVLNGDTEPQTHYFGRAHADGLMQLASLSKAVSATVILMVADQNDVGIDDDIRAQIVSIDIAALAGGDRPVTLRQILSHTTGASQSGYPGYPRDGDVPTTDQVIGSPPRFFEFPLEFDGTPGKFRYSGGGYTIAQLWVEDVTGKSFEVVAQDMLFGPLRMEQSTFAQSSDRDDFAPYAIIGADSGFAPTQGVFSSLEDSWHIYPEKAAAGLWSTSNDYARFVTALLDSAASVENPIPSAIAQAVITPEAETDFAPDMHYGMGVMLSLNDNGDAQEVWHTGANAGYRSIFIARPATNETPRQVVVVTSNTASAAYLNRATATALIER
ncbi:MAG: serine hydrolase domain-containing protein [Erythrobacter sp.]